MDLNKDYLKDLFIDEVKGCLGSDGDVQSSITSLENGKADKNGAALTGTPTAPTAAKGTNTTQIATTAFVQSAIPKTVKVTATDDGNGNISLSFKQE